MTPDTDGGLAMMNLPPYRAVLSYFGVSILDGHERLTIQRDQLDNILRHFLKLIPFDENAYLSYCYDVKDSISRGHYPATGRQHFIDFGYFEGRQPFGPYLPEPQNLTQPPYDVPDAYYMLLAKAWKQIGGGDLRKAELTLRAAKAQFPSGIHATALLGFIALKMGYPAEAYQTLGGLVGTPGETPEVLLWLAEGAEVLGLPDQRVEYLGKAHLLPGPRRADIAVMLFHAMLDAGRIGDAVKVLREVPLERLGGGSIAAKRAADRAITAARMRVRQLLGVRRSQPLLDNEASELSRLLALLGFRRRATSLVNALLASEGVSQKPELLIELAEAARVAGTVTAAIAVLSAHTDSARPPRLVSQLSELLYRAGRIDEAATTLAAVEETAANEQGLRCAALSALLRRDLGQALLACRAWMEAYPESHGWAPLGIMILSEMRAIPHVRVLRTQDRPSLPFTTVPVIPRRIGQYWNSAEIPPDVADAMASWVTNNPDHVYDRFDDTSARKFILESHGPNGAEAFDACRHPSMRCDYLRLAYLAARGGVFADADDRSIVPLDTALSNCSDMGLLVIRNDRFYIDNFFIAAAKDHPLVRAMLGAATSEILSSRDRNRPLDIWRTTGPGLVTRTIARRILSSDGSPDVFFKHAAFITQSDGESFRREELFAYKQTDAGNWRIMGGN